MRTIADIWKAVEDQRPADVSVIDWKRSYNGVKAGLKHVGFELLTSREQLDSMDVPLQGGGTSGKAYSNRKVVVSRNRITSQPSRIHDLLNGNSGVLTEAERLSIYTSVGKVRSTTVPKGVAMPNHAESRAADELDALIDTQHVLKREHLLEHRLADIAYSFKDADPDYCVWLGNQIKHSIANEAGRCHFNKGDTKLTISGMVEYLRAGLSLTCIGKTSEDKVDVVWYFCGDADVDWLLTFDSKQTFQPRLHLKRASPNKFTIAYNATEHRFDVGKSAAECERLLQRKMSDVKGGKKYTLTFLNEDDSQIPSENHRIEHKAFALTRAACATAGVTVKHLHEDAYGPVDFRVAATARVQDKVSSRRAVDLRHEGKHPYNPDMIDIFQITDIDRNQVYALSMRVTQEDGQVVSFFSEEDLMRRMLVLSAKWKEANKQHLYNLNDPAGIRGYINACTTASKIPQLTDKAFYSNMLATNKDMFGSEKQLQQRKTAVAIEASSTSQTG